MKKYMAEIGLGIGVLLFLAIMTGIYAYYSAEYVKDKTIVAEGTVEKYRILLDTQSNNVEERGYMPQIRMGDRWYDMTNNLVSFMEAKVVIEREKLATEKGRYLVIDTYGGSDE